MQRGWLFKLVPIFIGGCFILIVVYWISLAVVAYQVASDPDAIAHRIGQIAGAARDGFDGKSK